MVDVSKFKEEEALGYNISIIGRHVQVTEAMKNHAFEKLGKVERFHNHIMNLVMTLDIQKLEHSVVIVLKIDHLKIKVHASSTDMYASIDKAIDKLQALLRRYKSKIQDHHRKKLSVVDMRVNVLRRPRNDEEEFNADLQADAKMAELRAISVPEIVGTETRPLKTLQVEEAIMKMELSGDHFLIFRDEVDRDLKVIYRRVDGNYGIIMPQ